MTSKKLSSGQRRNPVRSLLACYLTFTRARLAGKEIFLSGKRGEEEGGGEEGRKEGEREGREGERGEEEKREKIQ